LDKNWKNKRVDKLRKKNYGKSLDKNWKNKRVDKLKKKIKEKIKEKSKEKVWIKTGKINE
jgi:hypothetical protein